MSERGLTNLSEPWQRRIGSIGPYYRTQRFAGGREAIADERERLADERERVTKETVLGRVMQLAGAVGPEPASGVSRPPPRERAARPRDGRSERGLAVGSERTRRCLSYEGQFPELFGRTLTL